MTGFTGITMDAASMQPALGGFFLGFVFAALTMKFASRCFNRKRNFLLKQLEEVVLASAENGSDEKVQMRCAIVADFLMKEDTKFYVTKNVSQRGGAVHLRKVGQCQGLNMTMEKDLVPLSCCKFCAKLPHAQ